LELKKLAVTVTARGITTKQILIGTTSDQIVGLDKRLVDPRRPSIDVYSNDDREEGLIPYNSTLFVFDKIYVSYNKIIGNLREIITSPSLLESTSLVFAYGTDIFYIQSTPSKTYDLISHDFNYTALLATVAILCVSSIIFAYITSRKDLNRMWK